ncbi:MAG: DUF6431 domain-containing protein [Anaeroplasmataceae bacterium]
MISYNKKNYSVENYNNIFINISNIKCSCGCVGSCIKYGKYKRKYLKNGKKLIIFIQRIYCKVCQRTHAILPSNIVPYKLVLFDDLIEVIESYEEEIEITDPSEKRIIKTYNEWKERLKKMIIRFNRDDIDKIIFFSALNYKMGFMQEKRKIYRIKSVIYESNYIITNIGY